MRLAGGGVIVISRAGEPVAPVLIRATVRRSGRGSLRGQIRMARHYDEPHPGIASAFGMV
ncbi:MULTISPECIES: prevent-host-death protein [unclassified Streptomyces]|uniref:prevent-host-death protein n=1 Tax=unclassified Streptomyces TaxID=2593676 RepID=UPI0037BB2A60